MTYATVRSTIVNFLTGRTPGTQVKVAAHQAAEIMLLDYIEQVNTYVTGSVVREAHASSTAAVNCNLVWNNPFSNLNYSFVMTAFDAGGNPAEVKFISKSTSGIVVKTLVNSTINALAIPFGISP